MARNKIGVILMTYGSPAHLDEIPAYIRNIYGGREPSAEVIAEFRRRYQLIGGSPLIRITNEQAEALTHELNRASDDGSEYQVIAGMRFAPPYITDLVPDLAVGADTVVGIIMSPQYSPIIMSGYVRTLTDAVADLKRSDLRLAISGDWHLQPFFLQAIAQRVRAALERFPEEVREQVPVLLSAHSMPKRVVEKEPAYIQNLQETARAVAELAGLAEERWSFCYQSAGHSKEEWLKPDFSDLIPELAKQGHRQVLMAPIQFLADHLEILYDIEIAAREQAEEHGLRFERIESLNTSPLFIQGLAAVVQDTIKAHSVQPV